MLHDDAAVVASLCDNKIVVRLVPSSSQATGPRECARERERVELGALGYHSGLYRKENGDGMKVARAYFGEIHDDRLVLRVILRRLARIYGAMLFHHHNRPPWQYSV